MFLITEWNNYNGRTPYNPILEMINYPAPKAAGILEFDPADQKPFFESATSAKTAEGRFCVCRAKVPLQIPRSSVTSTVTYRITLYQSSPQ